MEHPSENVVLRFAKPSLLRNRLPDRLRNLDAAHGRPPVVVVTILIVVLLRLTCQERLLTVDSAKNGLPKDQGRRSALQVAISRSERCTVPLRESPATRPTRSTGSRATTPPGRVSRSSSPRSLPSEMGRLPPSGRRAVPETL